MKVFFIYLTEVNVYLLFFFLLYVLMLKREPLFRMNRFFILISTFISFIFPLMNTFPVSLQVFTYQLPALEIGNESTAAISADGINWIFFAMLIYISGVIVRTILFLSELIKINKLGRLSLLKKSIQIYEVAERVSTASFLNNIYLNSDIDDENKDIVIAHETIHCRQKHSLDIIWMNIIKIICWFNPAVYFMEWRLKELHEFLVDREIIGENIEKEKYCSLLIGTALHINPYLLANHLSNYKLLKNRIAMMTQKKKSKQVIFKYFSLIPLITFGIFLISFSKVETASAQDANKNAAVHTDFNELDKMPEFPGGEQALLKYLGENIKYPESANEENIEGTVYIAFTIRPNGSISDVRDLRSPDKRLADEAIQVVENMPKWKAGEKDGEKVSVEYNLPIKFALANKDKAPAPPTPPTPPTPPNPETDKDLD